jgi:hypothetical protein
MRTATVLIGAPAAAEFVLQAFSFLQDPRPYLFARLVEFTVTNLCSGDWSFRFREMLDPQAPPR